MPIRKVKKVAKQLSTYYYRYGKYVASKTYLLLLFSLSFISYFSLPYLTKSLRPVRTPTTHNNIPLSQISTSLDAQCWHASAHVQFNNITSTSHLPSTSSSHYLITERIRLSHPDQPVNYDLIEQAKALYESITTTIVMEGDMPVSLASICYKHDGHCLIHAPPFSELRDSNDWKAKTNIHNQPKYQYTTHPYSVYSNTTFDPHGDLIKADAVLLTFVLKQTQNGNTLRIWNHILQEVKFKHEVIDMDQYHYNLEKDPSVWYASSNTPPQMIQYKFNLFPYELSYKVQISIVAYIIIFYLISKAFGKSNLVKSGYTFGLAAVFLSIACFTTTWGIFIKLGIPLNSVPWYLLLLSVNVGSLENVFLLTNAVLHAGCDMIVKEKVSRGLQSVGVPMTATLFAELFILSLGTQMDAALIKEFCTFTKVALCVEYVLEMTFIIAVLSIDIRRVELADLDDRQMSKRLHELRDAEAIQQNPDFCPVQDTRNKDDSKSCAECKQFKTHRVINALLLCFIVLTLSFFCSKESANRQLNQSRVYQPDLNQLSDQFWSTVNPEKDITWLQIQPPHLFVYSKNAKRVTHHIEQLQQLYLAKSMVVRTKIERRPSLFRQFILSSLQNALIFLIHINIPLLALCLVTLGIITWMTPKWRDQWLLPLITSTFNQSILTIIRLFQVQYFKLLYNVFIKGQPYYSESGSKEYDADGIHHRGAISVQNTFNQQQYRANVKHVQVRTLTHQHIADIQNLDANAKQSLVSCGQDGRIVLWNVDSAKSTWMARLDRLLPARGGTFQATLNPEFYSNSNKKKKNSMSSTNSSKKPVQLKKKKTPSVSKNFLSKARCVKVDQGNKWIAASFDDGVIRVWNVSSGTLLRELELHSDLPAIIEVQHDHPDKEVDSKTASSLRNRHNTSGYMFPSSNLNRKTAPVDRILFIQFVGVIAEYCHPLVAEAAARCNTPDMDASQNYIISAHKSGTIREWDILSGECIQTVKTGHTKDITQVHTVGAKAPHRKSGVTWVFTASKDGSVKCWERRLVASKDMENEDCITSKWNLVYTIQQNSPVTSIASELPVGGMGVLIVGCNDGSVHVYNFESGESICTLSVGKSTSVASSTTGSIDNNLMIGGPIRKFAKFSSSIQNELSSSSEDDEDEDEDEGIETSTSAHSSRKSSLTTASDHRGAVYQVVVTRYCEVENGPGLCRGCDTCFGNGFLVASSSMDNKVHAWRLERSDNGHEGSCTLCTKDYHRKQYKHRKSIAETDDGTHKLVTSRRRRSTSKQQSPLIKKKGAVANRSSANAVFGDLSTLELLDIEQLAGDVNISLKPTFLGKIDQPAGRGVVFCDKILAGVRRRRHSSVHNSKDGSGEWEAWFASLQYYDPSLNKEEGCANQLKIPVETFNLNENQSSPSGLEHKEAEAHTLSLRGLLAGLFSSASSTTTSSAGKEGHGTSGIKNKRNTHTSQSTPKHYARDNELDDVLDDEDTLEASENLPFSDVRHIIPLDGCGLACDFGNFIKLVYLDKPSLTEKERLKQSRENMEVTPQPPVVVKSIAEDVVLEEDEETDSGCQCDDDDNNASSCSPATKGVDGCCGGANKEKNGGKCCGGNVKKKQEEKRRQRALLKKKLAASAATVNTTNNYCSGVSIADCSLKNNCSRAADCASNSALTSNTGYSFNNWL